MAHYTPIDSGVFEAFLQRLGFTRNTFHNEVVYEFRHRVENKLIIKVYTSISVATTNARGCGEDAIRIVAILDTGSRTYPIFKAQRVFRTTSQESVQARVHERTRAAYARCNEWIKEQRVKNGSFNFGANQK